jgi:phosphatidylethanolamine-binding protein (PEBP) family uncharacterized protein
LECPAAGTRGLVFVLEDLDNPGATPGIHTIAAFAPAEGGLPEGALTPDDPRFQFLPNRRRQAKYVGLRPLPGHGPHRYRYHLYALDTDVDLTKVADLQAVPSGSGRACPGLRNAHGYADVLTGADAATARPREQQARFGQGPSGSSRRRSPRRR